MSKVKDRSLEQNRNQGDSFRDILEKEIER